MAERRARKSWSIRFLIAFAVASAVQILLVVVLARWSLLPLINWSLLALVLGYILWTPGQERRRAHSPAFAILIGVFTPTWAVWTTFGFVVGGIMVAKVLPLILLAASVGTLTIRAYREHREPQRVQCRLCHASFFIGSKLDRCPACGEANFVIIDEMEKIDASQPILASDAATSHRFNFPEVKPNDRTIERS